VLPKCSRQEVVLQIGKKPGGGKEKFAGLRSVRDEFGNIHRELSPIFVAASRRECRLFPNVGHKIIGTSGSFREEGGAARGKGSETPFQLGFPSVIYRSAIILPT
jgi:hypothetical protein